MTDLIETAPLAEFGIGVLVVIVALWFLRYTIKAILVATIGG